MTHRQMYPASENIYIAQDQTERACEHSPEFDEWCTNNTFAEIIDHAVRQSTRPAAARRPQPPALLERAQVLDDMGVLRDESGEYDCERGVECNTHDHRRRTGVSPQKSGCGFAANQKNLRELIAEHDSAEDAAHSKRLASYNRRCAAGVHGDSEVCSETCVEYDDPLAPPADEQESCSALEGAPVFTDYWCYIAQQKNTSVMHLCAVQQIHCSAYLGAEGHRVRGRGRYTMLYVA